jgi:His-Xaa-Ser system radical SAM maturase HxsC
LAISINFSCGSFRTGEWAELDESLYAAVDHIHDHVVQAKGAFDETILGILKLKDRGQRVEIRVVLHKLTAPIIEDTGRWIARNLPFVDHVALMGLENTGFAIANDAMLWMDPVDYGNGLARAVDHLSAAGVNVSVYNLPKCVLPKSVWPHALQSISDWKNGFVEECDRCAEKNTCSVTRGLLQAGQQSAVPGIALAALAARRARRLGERRVSKLTGMRHRS